ncbi:MAG: hypothetical protein ACTSYD_06550 [Candidatus Heimdallarchaeaceae archaeon]
MANNFKEPTFAEQTEKTSLLVYPVDSLEEEQEKLKQFYCPHCKLRGYLHYLRHENIKEGKFVYTYVEGECDNCHQKAIFKFFITSDSQNKKAKEYQEYASLKDRIP